MAGGEEVGVGYVRLIPSLRGFRKAAEKEMRAGVADPARKAGKDAGDGIGDEGKPAGKRFGAGLMAGLKDSTSGVSGLGESAGSKFGSGFQQGVRPRDAFGRFLPASEPAGEDSGKRFGLGFLKGYSEKSQGFAKKLFRGFGKELGVTAKPTAMTAATAFSAQFVAAVGAGLASGIGKLAHGLGSIAALLPAAAGAGILAFGTLKVAVLGVGDALTAGLAGDTEAFNEAIKGLSPSARQFARSVAGMKDELDDLKSTVQENFFSQFADQTKKLGSTYLPVLKSAMGGVAASFGRAVHETAGFLTLPKTSGAVSMALGHMGKAIDNVASAIAPMIRAFLPLVTVGATFLPRLTGGLTSAATEFARFMENARDTGKLAQFIQGGLDKLRSLWETAKQVGRIFEDIIGIGSKLFSGVSLSGGHLLDTIESGVDGLNRFFETAKGSSILAEVMETGRAVIGTLMGTLQRLAGILGRAFGPILPQILDFIEAFSNLKSAVLDVALDALEPILVGLGAVLGGVVLPALTGLANWLSNNQQVLQAVGIAIMAMLVPAFIAWAVSAGAAAVATIAATWPILAIGAAIAALAYLIIHNWDTIKKATAAVVGFIADHWQGLLQILTGPIGLAVALITRHWKSIREAVGAVVGWIGEHWRGLLQILTGPIGLAVAFIMRHWETIKSAVGAVISWISDHWLMLLAILSLPLAIFVAFVITQWEHIRAFITTVLGAIATVVTTVFGFLAAVITTAFGVVATAVTTVFRFIAAVAMVVFNAIKAVVVTVFTAISAAVRLAGSVIIGIWRAIRNTAVAVWQAIWSKTASVRDAISGAVGWLRDRIVGVFNSVRDGVAGAWESIKGAISAVVEWIAGKVESVMGMIGDIGNAISNIPGAGVVGDIIGAFDVGGVVPGPKGAPALAIVHGGETVVPTHDPAAMRNFATDQFTDSQHAAIATTRVAGPAPARMIIDVTGGPPEMVRLFKKMIRTDGHGDPVAYLTP